MSALRPEELQVESFVVQEASFQPTDFTDAAAKDVPNSWPDCPTATGCTCFETCFGGVCHTATGTSA